MNSFEISNWSGFYGTFSKSKTFKVMKTLARRTELIFIPSKNCMHSFYVNEYLEFLMYITYLEVDLNWIDLIIWLRLVQFVMVLYVMVWFGLGPWISWNCTERIDATWAVMMIQISGIFIFLKILHYNRLVLSSFNLQSFRFAKKIGYLTIIYIALYINARSYSDIFKIVISIELST